ncbi:hypothetical protein BDN72DRAFT_943116 [Pluteus cervinus]|uniref:Uncharacterized protein n=1 Tax=Pluteus cervinus TaxID=181527 RepID=A0ACD3A287_9AGAR|nr:hypothetical protein BDN72DRAFT_943116 [Pluteus cervinus]
MTTSTDNVNLEAENRPASDVDHSPSDEDPDDTYLRWKNGQKPQHILGRPPPKLSKLKSLVGLRHPWDIKFDDYVNGPTLSALDPIPDTIKHLGDTNVMYIAGRVMQSSWTTYVDYGWRLEPDFAQSFYLTPPDLVKEHLIPVGLPTPPTVYPPENETGRRGEEVRKPDGIEMGAREMIEEGNREGTNAHFLTGKTQDDKYIFVNLQRDAVTPPKILKSCDIDSLIWVGRRPKFRKSISVYQTPNIRDRPPIWKNNHIYVDILVPPSDQDRINGGLRTEWWAQSFPLSRIPHLLFATMERVDLLLFHPRLTHRQPYTNYWAKSIPFDIQYNFWTRVVIPTIKKVTASDLEPYVGLSRENIMLKVRRKGKGGDMPAYPFSPEVFDALIEGMTQLVEDDPALDLYGSMFFVVQLKGSKGFSKVAQPLDENLGETLGSALDRFRDEFDGLDWEYMENRSNGELVCDVGLTFTPVSDEPLVGLWRLDSTKASYQAGGYLQGNTHNLNTLHLYGGVQAEMSKERRLRTHISFRQSYNLAYEVIRQKDNSRDLFSTEDLYNGAQRVTKDINGIEKVYKQEASTRTYGVREEIRLGGLALGEMMNVIDDAVEELLASQPILWISSRTWFEFLNRRMTQIKETQDLINVRQPKNHAVLTGVLACLIQSIFFTPERLPTVVRRTLRELNFDASQQRFGMFFLHDWNPKRKGFLKLDIQDDASVFQELGITKKKSRNSNFHLTFPEEWSPAEFPLGPRPSWQELQSGLETEPWKVVNDWTWPEELDAYLSSPEDSVQGMASSLFTRFTTHVWFLLNKDYKTKEVTSLVRDLKVAMEWWSVKSVLGRVNADLRALNSGINGLIPGPKQQSFKERRKLYFFLKDKDDEPTPPGWRGVCNEPAYNYTYREMMKTLNEEDQMLFNGCLEELLGVCQCLPTGQRSGKEGRLWEVKDMRVRLYCNPIYYRIKSIGIGEGLVKRTRQPAGQRPLTSLQLGLFNLDGIDERVLMKSLRIQKMAQKALLNRKSGSTKNYRKPPKGVKGKTEVEGAIVGMEEGGSDEDLGVLLDVEMQDDVGNVVAKELKVKIGEDFDDGYEEDDEYYE